MTISQPASPPFFPSQPTPPFFPSQPTPPSRRAQTVVGAVFGVLGAIALTGGAVIGLATAYRTNDGYLTSDPGRLGSDLHAVVVPALEVDGIGTDGAFLQQFLGSIRITVDGSDEPLFVGIAPSDKVADYLAGVSYDEVEDFMTSPFRADYRAHNGGAPVGSPAAQDFWLATTTTTAPQVLTWDVVPGNWSVVLMNADGSDGVEAYVTVGTTIPVLGTIGTAMAWVGGVFLAIGVVMMVGSAVGNTRDRRQWDETVRRS